MQQFSIQLSSVAVASAANFQGISKQITEQYHDFAQLQLVEFD